MKKIIALGVAGLACIALLAMISTMSVNRLARACSANAAHALLGATAAGMTIKHLDLPPPMVNVADLAIIWPRLDAEIAMEQGHEWLAGKTLRLHMNAPAISLESLFPGRFMVKANDISASIESQEPATAGKNPTDGLTSVSDGLLSVPIRLEIWPLSSIKHQLKERIHDMLGLLHSGSTTVPVSFWGTSSFRVNDEIVNAALSVQEQGAFYRLTMDKESLQVISWIMAEKLTAPEVELLAVNPIKAPRLLRIRDDAQESARKAHEEQTFVPEDAYRHVLWSYLLSQSYGPAFAKEVTDAHEQGTTDNSAAEHRMDQANNAVGRKYAAQRLQREELIDRLRNDPEVIRDAEAHSPR